MAGESPSALPVTRPLGVSDRNAVGTGHWIQSEEAVTAFATLAVRSRTKTGLRKTVQDRPFDDVAPTSHTSYPACQIYYSSRLSVHGFSSRRHPPIWLVYPRRMSAKVSSLESLWLTTETMPFDFGQQVSTVAGIGLIMRSAAPVCKNATRRMVPNAYLKV